MKTNLSFRMAEVIKNLSREAELNPPGNDELISGRKLSRHCDHSKRWRAIASPKTRRGLSHGVDSS